MTSIISNSDIVRQCPQCKRELYYTTKSSFTRANHLNSICKSCYYNRPEAKGPFLRNCPNCNREMEYLRLDHYNVAKQKNVLCNSCGQKKREYSYEWGIKMKEVLHRPNVRKKHLDAIRNSTWAKVKTDKGQLELLEKWNRLGFHFEPNYKIHSNTEFFYIDGYDKEKNIVLEYDSKYHFRPYIQQKDLVRQQKIISLLHPKKFWRYNSVNKTFRNVLIVKH